MKLWASDYLKTKTARVKTADNIWNAVGGGIPYSVGVRQALSEHPELSNLEAEHAGGGTLRPLVGGVRTLGHGLVGAAGGGLLGAGIGAGMGVGAHMLGLGGAEAVPLGEAAGVGAGAGGLAGAGAGALDRLIMGGYGEGKGLTEEEIAEMERPEAQQRTTFARHPVAGTIGGALAPVGIVANPTGLIPNAVVGGIQNAIGRPRE